MAEDFKIELTPPIEFEENKKEYEVEPPKIDFVSIQSDIKKDNEVEKVLNDTFYQMADALSIQAGMTTGKMVEDIKEVTVGLYELLKSSPEIILNTASEVYESASKMEEGEVQISPNAKYVSSLEKEPFDIMPDTSAIPTLEESAAETLTKPTVFSLGSTIATAYNNNFGISDLANGDWKTAAAKTLAYADRDPLLFAADTLMLTLALGKLTSAVGKTSAIAKYTQALTSIPDTPIIRAGEVISQLDNPFTYMNPIAKSALKTFNEGINAISNMDQLANAGFIKTRNVGFGVNFKSDIAKTTKKIKNSVSSLATTLKKESQQFGKIFDEINTMRSSTEALNDIFMQDTTRKLSKILSPNINTPEMVDLELSMFNRSVNGIDSGSFGRTTTHYLDDGDAPILIFGYGKKEAIENLSTSEIYPKLQEMRTLFDEINLKFKNNVPAYNFEFVDKYIDNFIPNAIIKRENGIISATNEDMLFLRESVNKIKQLKNEIVSSSFYKDNFSENKLNVLSRHYDVTPEEAKQRYKDLIKFDEDNGTNMTFYAMYREGIHPTRLGLKNSELEFPIGITKQEFNEKVPSYYKFLGTGSDEQFKAFKEFYSTGEGTLYVNKSSEIFDFMKDYEQNINPYKAMNFKDLFVRENIESVLTGQMRSLYDSYRYLLNEPIEGRKISLNQSYAEEYSPLMNDSSLPINEYVNSKVKNMTDINLMPYEKPSMSRETELYKRKELNEITTASRLRNDFYIAMNQTGIDKIKNLSELNAILEITSEAKKYSKNDIDFIIKEEKFRSDFLKGKDDWQLKIEKEIERGSPRTKYVLTKPDGSTVSYTKVKVESIIPEGKPIEFLVEDTVYDNFFYKTPAGSDPTPGMIKARMGANALKTNLLMGTGTVVLNFLDETVKTMVEIFTEPSKFKSLFDPTVWKINMDEIKNIFSEITGKKFKSNLDSTTASYKRINEALKGNLYEKYDISKKHHEQLLYKAKLGEELTKTQKVWNKYVDLHQRFTDIAFSLYGGIDVIGKNVSNISEINKFLDLSGTSLKELETSVSSLYNSKTAAKWEELRKAVRKQTAYHFDLNDKVLLSKSLFSRNPTKNAPLEFAKATSLLFTSFPMMALNAAMNRALIIFTGSDMWGNVIPTSERVRTAVALVAMNIIGYKVANMGIDLSEITNFGIGADANKVVNKQRREALDNSEKLKAIVKEVYKDNVKSDGFVYVLDEINKMFSKSLIETAGKNIVKTSLPLIGSRMAEEAQRFAFNTNTDLVSYILNKDSAEVERAKTLQDIALGRFFIKESKTESKPKRPSRPKRKSRRE